METGQRSRCSEEKVIMQGAKPVFLAGDRSDGKMQGWGRHLRTELEGSGLEFSRDPHEGHCSR